MAADAQRWQKLDTAPYTLNNKQDAIAFVDANHGWYGNGTGRIWRTDDSGDHWMLRWHHRGTYVRALAFADAVTGFAGNVGPGYFSDVRDRHPLYVTHDGGEHWQPARIDGAPVAGLCAIDLQHLDGKTIVRAGGRVGGPAALIESFDAGLTWRSRDMSAVTGMVLDIHFVDAKTGFIAGASEADESKAHARILRTTDGGATWAAVFDSDRAGDNNWKLAFPTSRIGFATIISYDAPKGDARGYVVKTDDAGAHWHPLVVTHDPQWIPYGIGFLDTDRGYVGGSTGGYETRDGGTTWHSVDIGLSVNKFSFVTMPDGHIRAFAIGESVYRTDFEGR